MTTLEEQLKAEAVETEITIPDLELIADRVIENKGDASAFFQILDEGISES